MESASTTDPASFSAITTSAATTVKTGVSSIAGALSGLSQPDLDAAVASNPECQKMGSTNSSANPSSP
jgi:hypothetical protein